MGDTGGWGKTGVWVLVLGTGLMACAQAAQAAGLPPSRVSDIRQTKHNLSSVNYGGAGGASRTVKASTEGEVCVFCHTPHGAISSGADASVKPPLWNRNLSTQTYTKYSSRSIDATVQEISSSSGGTSKLCLSCHDGSIAIGKVNVLDGAYNSAGITINMGGIDKMPAGAYGSTTGFTRNLGTDMTNDHPINFTYDASLVTKDGELRDLPVVSLAGKTIVGNRTSGSGKNKPTLPLENNMVQCASCHDPHIRDDRGTTQTSIKFLRLHRFQERELDGVGGTYSFDPDGDIICMACHAKDNSGWYNSVHAQKTPGAGIYKSAAAGMREFTTGAETRTVWQAACLNCHDPHTVPGAERLLREGIEGNYTATTPKSAGGAAAIEETCYQCHRASSDPLNILTSSTAPDIRTEFLGSTGTNKRMPITNADQGVTDEVHDIDNMNFEEDRARLGWGNLNNRHVECTDCHNPHRAIKNQRFDGTGSSSKRTHDHGSSQHSNIISGVLKGMWGVEPVWANFNTTWLSVPADGDFLTKTGDAGVGSAKTVDPRETVSYVTREYQICLKCHSNYAYTDNGNYNSTGGQLTSGRPLTKSGRGTTDSSAGNGLKAYSNQASEWAVRANASSSGADQVLGASIRSWHPVTFPTDRPAGTTGGATDRGAPASNWNAPFNNGVGSQTMYCSDCHGSNAANTGQTTPTSGVWGPHGSSNPFILRGAWSENSRDLCIKCHSNSVYNTKDGGSSGFSKGDGDASCCDSNYHGTHWEKVNTKCNRCHIAVPHGWKNKSFLVNLNRLGPETSNPEGTNSTSDALTHPPYYMGAKLRVLNFALGTGWSAANCGKSSSNNGTSWMNSGSGCTS